MASAIDDSARVKLHARGARAERETTGGRTWWGAGTAPRRCGTTEVIEDAVDHLGLCDEGNDAHGLPAAGTFQGLNCKPSSIYQELSYFYSVKIGWGMSVARKVQVLPVPRHERAVFIRKGINR